MDIQLYNKTSVSSLSVMLCTRHTFLTIMLPKHTCPCIGHEGSSNVTQHLLIHPASCQHPEPLVCVVTSHSLGSLCCPVGTVSHTYLPQWSSSVSLSYQHLPWCVGQSPLGDSVEPYPGIGQDFADYPSAFSLLHECCQVLPGDLRDALQVDHTDC